MFDWILGDPLAQARWTIEEKTFTKCIQNIKQTNK